MNCVNCSADVQTPYCPSCGQRTGVKRLTLRDTFADVWNNLSGFDGLFLRTLKDLTRRPGRVAAVYITGVRIRYFGPVSYFFFMITLLLLWTSALGFDFVDLIRDRQDALSQADRKGVDLMTQWIGDNIKWFLFLAVPFQAVAARSFFFRRSGYNLVEHTVPLFYASGHLFWLSMVSLLLKKITGDEYIVFITLLEVGYFGFLYADLMRYQSRAKAFTKGIGVYFTGQILFIAVFTLIVMLSILVLAVVNPEALELFRPSRP